MISYTLYYNYTIDHKNPNQLTTFAQHLYSSHWRPSVTTAIPVIIYSQNFFFIVAFNCDF